MDPPGVEDESDKWGFITRLEHLDDVNSPFSLYKRGEVEHFKLETDAVGLGTTTQQNTVVGRILQALERVGSSKERKETRSRETFVLCDPMTKEPVSKVAELDEDGKPKFDRAGNTIYKYNDYWFVLNAKFVWKDAPERPRASRFAGMFMPIRAPKKSE